MHDLKDYKSRQAVLECGGVPLILNLVMSDFPVIQHLALKTLQILTTDREICIAFREAQGFEKLMDILNNAVGAASNVAVILHICIIWYDSSSTWLKCLVCNINLDFMV